MSGGRISKILSEAPINEENVMVLAMESKIKSLRCI